MRGYGYTGPINRFGGYYIHYHQTNIGKAENHKIPNIINVFQTQRERVLRESKNIYRKLFQANLISTSSMELLKEVFSDEDVFTELNRQMTEQMQKMIDTDRIGKLISIQRDILEKNKDIDFSSLASTKQTKDQLKSLNTLLDKLSECCLLLNSKEGAYLASLLTKAQQLHVSRKKDPPRASFKLKNLNKALNTFIAKNNGVTIDEQRALAAAESINLLAQGLITGKTTSKEGITEENLKKLVDYIFNTGFAEGIASMIDQTAVAAADEMIINLTGKDMVPGISIDKEGTEIITDIAEKAGKTDIKFSNIQFQIQQNSSSQGGQVTMEVGLSNKLYRTNHFPDLDKRFKSQAYSSGSGGTFKEAIDTIFENNNIYNKYLAYNVMAHRSECPKEAQALQDLILTRQLVKLFSSRGGKKDFSQWILANGQIISIWELILSTTKNVGLSNSLSSKSSDQFVFLSLSTTEAEKAAKTRNAFQRIILTNHYLDSMTIKAYVHLDKMKNALSR